MLLHPFYEHATKLMAANCLDNIKLRCGEFLADIGIHFFRYEWEPPAIYGNRPQRFAACPPAWLAHYIECEYGAIDPKVTYAKKNRLPFLWQPDHLPPLSNRVEKQFWEDSIQFGLGYGATIPLRGRLGGSAMFCLSLPEESAARRKSMEYLPPIEAFALHVQHRVEELFLQAFLPEKPLTQRETEIVRWTASGKTADEISGILSVSTCTVVFHLNNAKQKLNVLNKHQLTVRAMALGLL